MPTVEPPIAFVLGLPFHRTTMQEVLRDCETIMEEDHPRYVVTANADFVAQAYRDDELREILFFACRVVCDGMPLVWLSRLFGNPLPERVAGSDMVFHLFKLCARRKFRVYFLGSDSATLNEVKFALRKKYPGLEICGSFSPPIAPVEAWPNEEIVAAIQQAQPHLLLVAVGCPKQERWIARYSAEAGVPLSIGIGASLDFISGKQVRSPRWMQRTGLEWLWRLFSDPRRLAGRYWKDFRYLVLLSFKQASVVFRRPRRIRGSGSGVLFELEGLGPEVANTDLIRLEWDGAIQRDNLDDFNPPSKPDRPLLCDVSGVTFIDSSGVGLLVRVARTCRDCGVPVAFLSESGMPVADLVKGLHLDSVLKVFADEESAESWLQQEWKQTARRETGETTDGSFVLSGELDALNIEEVEKRMRAILERLPAGKVLRVPCRQLTFIDSIAIGRLIALKKIAVERGCNLYLSEPSANVHRLLRVLHLHQLLIEP